MTNPKDYLRQLKRNLNALEERAAKAGRNVPVELMNQIEDHRRAIALTEQVEAAEISQAEWRAGLRRLNVDQPSLPTTTPPEASVPWQRPRRAEHFTNREKELDRLLAELQPGRVVTLCGPGGMGKSALRRPLDELVRFGLLLWEAQPSPQQPSPQPSPRGRGSQTFPPAGGIEGGLVPALNTPSLTPTEPDPTDQQPSPLLTSPSQREGNEPEQSKIQNRQSKIASPLQVSHALIHTYAREQQPPAAETLARLAAYYTDLAEAENAQGLTGYTRLDAERAHVLRVLAGCEEHKNSGPSTSPSKPWSLPKRLATGAARATGWATWAAPTSP